MAFTDKQTEALKAPLKSCNVKNRSQGGRSVSYIEGWKAIDEANRIFGFDAWSRETIEFKCVSEFDREIGQRKDKGWGVTYIAKVRVTVGTIIREGCGTGHGIDRDLGQAHESALKEAETDAMKRALMTFGNPFGLALYDKEQANVSDTPPEPSNTTLDIIAKIDECETTKAMSNYGASIAEAVAKLSAIDADRVREHFGKRMKALKQADNLAA